MTDSAKNVCVVGIQWGDEGKGKLVDVLTRDFDVVVRYQGGANAGHTVQIGEAEYILHLIPSGILQEGKVCVIGNGVVIDPSALIEELDQLREQGRSVYEAAREASLVRLRPILMTMASTVLAGLPLILGSGPGSEARGAIGWVVFGGLGLAGSFTLILTPALYVLIARFSKPRNLAAQQLDSELEQAAALPVASEAAALPAPKNLLEGKQP